MQHIILPHTKKFWPSSVTHSMHQAQKHVILSKLGPHCIILPNLASYVSQIVLTLFMHHPISLLGIPEPAQSGHCTSILNSMLILSQLHWWVGFYVVCPSDRWFSHVHAYVRFVLAARPLFLFSKSNFHFHHRKLGGNAEQSYTSISLINIRKNEKLL